MDSLDQLRRRKAELKEKIAQQQTEIKQTFQELRQEFEPEHLIKKAVGGFFQSSAAGNSGIGLLADLLIKDRRLALLARWVAPFFMRFFRRAQNTLPAGAKARKSFKAGIYGNLRKNISALRNQLKNKEKAEEQPETDTKN